MNERPSGEALDFQNEFPSGVLVEAHSLSATEMNGLQVWVLHSAVMCCIVLAGSCYWFDRRSCSISVCYAMIIVPSISTQFAPWRISLSYDPSTVSSRRAADGFHRRDDSSSVVALLVFCHPRVEFLVHKRSDFEWTSLSQQVSRLGFV